MKIGIASLQWLPLHGGANIYAYRVARALRARGHTVEIATGTPAREDRDNGELSAFRSPSPVPEEPAACREWYARLEPWFQEHRFTHVLVNAPLSRPEHSHARELYQLAQRSGARVGAIHLDIGRNIATELNWAYALTHSWEQAAQRALEKIRAHLAQVGEDEGHRDLDSPLYFQPDFVLSCSEWSDRFVDPLDRSPRVVLRPLVDDAPSVAPGGAAGGEPALEEVDISFVNPLPHKGVRVLIDLIREGPPGWTFRVLHGGYGEGIQSFLEAVRDTPRYRAGRVHTVPYRRDMRDVYTSTRLLLFPSLYEGYGMAAVEPLFEGTPVVANGYPAILEGVGEGACVVPYAAPSARWLEATERVLAERPVWVERARARAAALRERQAREVLALEAFLQAL